MNAASAAQLPAYVPTPTPAESLWQRVGLPERGQALQAAIDEGLPFIMFERLARETGFTQQQLREIAGIARTTLLRREREGRFTQAEGDRLYRFAAAYQAALRLWADDAGAAHDWLLRPAKGLGGARPVDLLQTMVGAEQVLDLVGRIEHGVNA